MKLFFESSKYFGQQDIATIFNPDSWEKVVKQNIYASVIQNKAIVVFYDI